MVRPPPHSPPGRYRSENHGDETINAWQCYTATGAPFAEHPYGIAVEPMTAPANAFRTGDHLVTLAPNGDYTTVVRYEVVQK